MTVGELLARLQGRRRDAEIFVVDENGDRAPVMWIEFTTFDQPVVFGLGEWEEGGRTTAAADVADREPNKPS